MKRLSIILSIIVVSACSSSGDENVHARSIELHEAALEIGKQVKNKIKLIETRASNSEDSVGLVLRDSAQALLGAYNEWNANMVEVPGHEHDHGDQDGHNHDGQDHGDHEGHDHDDHKGHDHDDHDHGDHEEHDHDDHEGHDHDDHEGHNHNHSAAPDLTPEMMQAVQGEIKEQIELLNQRAQRILDTIETESHI